MKTRYDYTFSPAAHNLLALLICIVNQKLDSCYIQMLLCNYSIMLAR